MLKAQGLMLASAQEPARAELGWLVELDSLAAVSTHTRPMSLDMESRETRCVTKKMSSLLSMELASESSGGSSAHSTPPSSGSSYASAASSGAPSSCALAEVYSMEDLAAADADADCAHRRAPTSPAFPCSTSSTPIAIPTTTYFRDPLQIEERARFQHARCQLQARNEAQANEAHAR